MDREKRMKRKKKKKEALKQRRVHFQTSLTRFHVYREINPDEAGNSAPAQRQRRSMSRFFTEAVSMSFLFFCGPKARFGSMTSRGNLFPSVPLIRPSRFLCSPSKVFSLPPPPLTNRSKPRLIIEPRDGLGNPALSFSCISASVTSLTKGVQSRERCLRIVPAKWLLFIALKFYTEAGTGFLFFSPLFFFLFFHRLLELTSRCAIDSEVCSK